MDTLRKPISWLLTAFLGANGLAMLLSPQPWYTRVPGVILTGAYNPHFIRDVGATYLVVAAGLAWSAIRPRAAEGAVLAALWLVAHAIIHLNDAAFCGRPLAGELLRDFAGVHVPALIAVWLSVASLHARKARA